MAFETLSERLQSALKSVTRKGKLTEKDVDVMMREVRLALLEADVNIKVVREFIKEVKEKAIGETVLKSLTPGQQVIKIVNEELTKLMIKHNVGVQPKQPPIEIKKIDEDFFTEE